MRFAGGDDTGTEGPVALHGQRLRVLDRGDSFWEPSLEVLDLLVEAGVEIHGAGALRNHLQQAVVVNLIATVLKFGDRTQIGAVHLATSLVADLQLIAAALVWGYFSYVAVDGVTREATAAVVSLSGGALMANIVSVVLLVVETVSFHRR